ncbi:acetoin utilization deacetylase AcuC-like enzyme [Methanolinea mesophila]|uniref:histone deacetylase family protein n=1 Tax=Methanolinea mesophila TaxID=547055 RepID=UPI001AEB379E|nr:histone deacetylase [Methanolinea mesophila]MBP1927547.1 acetoin utilization deacetylase AcuC-like enzyme [Methanolinea mesophila]
MTTGIVYDRAYLLHEQSPTHPERRERLAYTLDQLEEEGIWDFPGIVRLVPYPAPEEAVLAVHIPEYVGFLKEASRGGGFIDFDTSVPAGLWDAALLAAGGAMRAADAVIDKEAGNAFALVRPPGHHARMGTGAGFCYLNNMAVMVRHLQRRGVPKVLILDWDAHHGDGTQQIFYADPTVLFCSIHQSPFYPGSGMIDETGAGAGVGYTVNMPVPAGTGDDSYACLFREIIAPLAREFSPDFIAVSAGQDNHFTDPLTGLALTARGYADLMASTTDLASELCEGRLVAVLEGGYSVEGGLPYTNLGIIAAMAGLDLSGIREPSSLRGLLARAEDPSARYRVEEMAGALRARLAPFWQAFR